MTIRKPTQPSLFFLQVVAVVGVSLLLNVTSSSSSSYYSSIQALDKYGNSIQLSHARQASHQHGTLVLVGQSSSNKDGHDVVCVSLQQPTPPYRIKKNKNNRHDNDMIQIISTNTKNKMAMICTGIKADALYLIQKMKAYYIKTWERYDMSLNDDASRMVRGISQVLLDFMGYARSKEFLDAIGPVLEQSTDSSGTNEWARPLGVQTMLISTADPITLIEPSGVTNQYTACAMGRDSTACAEELERMYTRDITTEALRELLEDIIQRKVIDEHPNMYEKAELRIETLTKNGVECYTKIVSTKAKQN